VLGRFPEITIPMPAHGIRPQTADTVQMRGLSLYPGLHLVQPPRRYHPGQSPLMSTGAGTSIQNGSVAGWGSYSKGTSFGRINTTSPASFGVCTNTYCHSNGIGGRINSIGQARPIENNISPLWTSTPGRPRLYSCHGHETGNPGNGAPWYTSAWLNNNWTTAKANSHQAHASSGTPCFKCHYTTTNTGNTITSVGNHIKMNYTVSPGPGITYTYAFTTNGGTCTSTSCHGNGNMKWGTGTADCVSCHSGPSFPKALSIGTIRRVIGTGGDFNIPSTWVTPVGSRHLTGQRRS